MPRFVGSGQPRLASGANVIKQIRWLPNAGGAAALVGIGGAATLQALVGRTGGPNIVLMAATGTGTRNVNVVQDEPVMEIVPSGTGVVLMNTIGYDLRLVAAAGGAVSALNPIHRFFFRIARSVAGTPAADFFGIQFHPSSGAVVPASVGTTGVGFALVGDGAGQWKFIARKTGGAALTIDTVLTWPVALTEFVDVEFRVYPASSGEGARLVVLVDGVVKVDEDWDNGRLPLYSDLANGAVWTWSIRNQNAAYPNIEWAEYLELQEAANF